MFRRLYQLQRYASYPLIRDSEVQYLEWINPNATIIRSGIIGHVIVGEGSKIIDARLSGKITVGRRTTINGPNSDIRALVHEVKIGSFCSIARNVSIQEYNHNFDRVTSYFVRSNVFGESVIEDVFSKGSILVGNDVWIGTQSIILSNATISDGVVIGANSVVNSFIPPYAIAVGSPARVVRFRFPQEIINELLNIQWWNWDDEKIRNNRDFFTKQVGSDILSNIL